MVLKAAHLVIGAVLVAATAAGSMSYIAARHNPQGEFNSPSGQLSLGLLFSRIFLLYLVVVFVCFLFAGFLVKGVLDEGSKRRHP
jgi:hypothetical protein